jgi:Fe2+ or Zn2+ uptake regulation protein
MMQCPKNIFSERNDKLRMTQQRRVILEELRKDNIHPTADQLYEMVSAWGRFTAIWKFSHR